MAEAIVDQLEVIDIDKSQRALRAAPTGQTHHLLQPIMQKIAIGQTGQRIVRSYNFV